MSVHFKDERLQKHQPLAGKIKESLKVEGPAIKEEESHKAYFDNLPEGIDKATVENVAKYNQSFVSAAHVAVGEIAAEQFNSNSDLSRMDAEVGFFGKRDSVSITVHREKEFRNNFAEKEEDKTLKKHLVMNSSVSSSDYGLKSVRDAMSEEFSNSFAK